MEGNSLAANPNLTNRIVEVIREDGTRLVAPNSTTKYVVYPWQARDFTHNAPYYRQLFGSFDGNVSESTVKPSSMRDEVDVIQFAYANSGMEDLLSWYRRETIMLVDTGILYIAKPDFNGGIIIERPSIKEGVQLQPHHNIDDVLAVERDYIFESKQGKVFVIKEFGLYGFEGLDYKRGHLSAEDFESNPIIVAVSHGLERAQLVARLVRDYFKDGSFIRAPSSDDVKKTGLTAGLIAMAGANLDGERFQFFADVNPSGYGHFRPVLVLQDPKPRTPYLKQPAVKESRHELILA